MTRATLSPGARPTSIGAYAQVFATRRIYLYVTRKFEIHSGRRVVSIQSSVNALQAAVDYVRSFGCTDAEITRLGVDSVAWRGARFVAVPVPDEPAAAT